MHQGILFDLCEWIKTNGGGWIGRDNANTIGKKFIKDLSKSLWYIDNCSYKTLDDRFKIPEIFTNFFNRTHPEKSTKFLWEKALLNLNLQNSIREC